MITKDNSAGLVAGALKNNNLNEESNNMAEKKTKWITVMRPFRIKGRRKEIGAQVEVDIHLANEMISCKKAVEGKQNIKKPEPAAETK